MTLTPFTMRPVLKMAKPPRQLSPADQLLRDHALKEEGGRAVLAALRPLLKSVTFTAEGRRVIPAEIVEALVDGTGKPAFLKKCEG
jgi:hypothetical protein